MFLRSFGLVLYGRFSFAATGFGPTWPEVQNRQEVAPVPFPPLHFGSLFTKPKWRYHHEENQFAGFYPFYHDDLFVEVPDEVAEALAEAERLEQKLYPPRVLEQSILFTDAGDGY